MNRIDVLIGGKEISCDQMAVFVWDQFQPEVVLALSR